MLKTIFASIVFVSGLSLASEDPAPTDKVFVPQGFDSNDNIEVLLHGHFPNRCYQLDRFETRVDGFNLHVKLTANSYPAGSTKCDQITHVPFLKPVNFGMLEAGTYTVHVDGRDAKRTFTVKESPIEAHDDHLYAPVTSAEFHWDKLKSTQRLTIIGTFPHTLWGCMVIKDVETYLAPSDVLVVKPIADIIDGPECKKRTTQDFVYVTKPIKKETMITVEGLVHIRRIDGGSYNLLVNRD